MTDHYNDPFPTRLRELIEERKISQGDLASFLGIARQSFSLYCNGGTQPNIEKTVKIAEYFGVSVDYLYGLSNEKIKVDGYISAFDAAKIATNLPDDVVKRILSDENFRLAITNLAKYL